MIMITKRNELKPKKYFISLFVLLGAIVIVCFVFGICITSLAYAKENDVSHLSVDNEESVNHLIGQEAPTTIDIEVLEDNGNVLMDGGITFNSAIIKVNEELALFEMTRTPFGNKSEVTPVAYTYGALITEPGYYIFNARNTSGNYMSYRFYVVDTLINQHFVYKRPTGYKFNSLKRNGFDAYVNDDMDRIVFDADGNYEVQIENIYDGRTVDYFISIDTQPPTINTKGVVSGSIITSNNVTITSVSDDCVKLVVTCNGREIDYAIGEVLDINGEYVLSATDKAGNQTEIKFKLKKTINLIYVILGALIGVISVIGIGRYADKRRERKAMEALKDITNNESTQNDFIESDLYEINNQNINQKAEYTNNAVIEHSEEKTKMKAEYTNNVVLELRDDKRTVETTDKDNTGDDVCVLELATADGDANKESLIEIEQSVYKQEKKTSGGKKSVKSHNPKERKKNKSANFKKNPTDAPMIDGSSGAERSRIDEENSASDNTNDDNENQIE